MGGSLRVGDSIPLVCQTGNYSDTEYCRAFVEDANGDPVDGSPVNLIQTDDEGGYQNSELSMPNIPWVRAFIRFYSDSDYEVLSTENGGTDETFTLNTAGAGGGGTVSNIVGVVEPDGCSQQPIQDTIVQGSDRTISVRLVEDAGGDPFDLSGATLVEFRFRNADGSVLSLKSDDAGTPVVIASAIAGKLTCAISAEETALLAARIPAPFTIIVTQPIGVTVVNIATQLAVEEQDV